MVLKKDTVPSWTQDSLKRNDQEERQWFGCQAFCPSMELVCFSAKLWPCLRRLESNAASCQLFFSQWATVTSSSSNIMADCCMLLYPKYLFHFPTCHGTWTQFISVEASLAEIAVDMDEAELWNRVWPRLSPAGLQAWLAEALAVQEVQRVDTSGAWPDHHHVWFDCTRIEEVHAHKLGLQDAWDRRFVHLLVKVAKLQGQNLECLCFDSLWLGQFWHV